MNILVTGANGQLGMEMRNVATGSNHHFVFTDVNTVPDNETIYLDITNLDAIRIIAESEKIDCIVNCAAYTNVDKAEDDFAMADLLNHKAAENLALVANERDAVLIHISTDYVFKGNKSVPCREDWDTEPLGAYGITKLAGENAILNSGCKYIIFRTAWLYSPYGKNFVKTILALTAERESMKVVFDQVGTPTYAGDLANLILDIIENGKCDKTGIYHFSNEGVISWYDFAVTICELGGNNCKIAPCHSYEFPSKASRPAFSVLDKTKVKETFKIEIPYWKKSLECCIKRLKAGN